MPIQTSFSCGPITRSNVTVSRLPQSFKDRSNGDRRTLKMLTHRQGHGKTGLLQTGLLHGLLQLTAGQSFTVNQFSSVDFSTVVSRGMGKGLRFAMNLHLPSISLGTFHLMKRSFQRLA
jgi:hypothetical protein